MNQSARRNETAGIHLQDKIRHQNTRNVIFVYSLTSFCMVECDIEMTLKWISLMCHYHNVVENVLISPGIGQRHCL